MRKTTDTDRDGIVADGTASIREARRYLGDASRTALYAWMATGELPFVQLGRRRAIPRAALRRFAAARLHGARPDAAR